jgi:hypothetical protein
VRRPKQLPRSEYGGKVADFLEVAYKDYLAARVLFDADLLIQGAVLASTAIEKYLKAILAFRGNESHGHLKRAHWRAALNYDSRLSSILKDNRGIPTTFHRKDKPHNQLLIKAQRR